MNRLTLVIVAALATVILGCMPSLHPLYHEGDLTTLPGLTGVWQQTEMEGEGEIWHFSQVDSISYTLEYTENDTPGEFDARIVKLGDLLFIDICPISPESENDLYRGLLVPVHMFGRITISNDSLTIGWLDGDWLSRQADSNLINLKYEVMDEDRLITSSTDELQAFAQKFAPDTLAFPPTVLERVTP